MGRSLPQPIIRSVDDLRSNRFPRPTPPVSLPPLKGRIQSAAQMGFDDYYGLRPTKEDMMFKHRRTDEILEKPEMIYLHSGTGEETVKLHPWSLDRFIDRGYRLPSNFAQMTHYRAPTLPSWHVLQAGISREESEMPLQLHPSLQPHTLGRAEGTLRQMEVKVEVVGMAEMLAKAMERGSWEAEQVFVRGLDPETGTPLVVDLERDSKPLDEDSVHFKVDVDSVIFVGRHIRTVSAVKIKCGPTMLPTPPLSKDNKISVTLLEPPSQEEVDTLQFEWNTQQIPLFHIPHTELFRLEAEGSVLIFFPRMYRKEGKNSSWTRKLPAQIQIRFWDNIVLPALAETASPGSDIYVPTSVEEGQRKAKAGTGTGNLNSIKTLSVQPAHLEKFFDRMESRIAAGASDDPVISGFGSFICMVEGKGIKGSTHTVVEDDDSLLGENSPLAKMKTVFPQLDWEWMTNRRNGELYVDLAFSFNPDYLKKEPNGVAGLWRLKAAEASMGACGFRLGVLHNTNTLNDFGGMQADMSTEKNRMQRSQVKSRIMYNLLYEAARPKANHALIVDVESAMMGDITSLEQNAEREKYWEGAVRGRCFGVRDEYRM
ncbi:hypothetical protein BXZ70DRAFT_903093, partial [Cristinia sonorae]